MSRFQDHWKVDESIGARMPERLRKTPASHAHPVLSHVHGIPVWIHPSTDLPRGTAFVTDEGVGFDPEDAIINVQLERYMPPEVLCSARTKFLKKAYYNLKPLMPRSFQLALQRVNARSQLRNISFPAWPTDDCLWRFLNFLLAQLIEHTGQRQVSFIGFWPRGSRWAACFTHDVETAAGLRATKRMARIEETNGIRSTWFFVPERFPLNPIDFGYLAEMGHEIGLHGLKHDGRLFSSREEFDRRVPLINRYLKEWHAVGFRSPVLYRNADWLPNLEIRYDSSYMDTAVLEPQPGGVCNEFPFHLNDRVVELPITMPMDHHLINLLRTNPVETTLAKFRWVVERCGVAVFLFHPDYNLDQHRLDDYREIVDAVVGTEGGWIATGANIADWWQRRHDSKLVEHDGVVRIEGPASEDGAVWTASRKNGDVKLEVTASRECVVCR